MRYYKDVRVSWNEYTEYGRYYDPVEKVEKEGEIPPQGLKIGSTVIKKNRVTYKLSKEIVKENGTLISGKEIED